MEKFEDWYKEIVGRDDEICGFAPGVCICGKEGYHIECQEKQRPQIIEAFKYRDYLENVVRKLGYKKFVLNEQNINFLDAEKKLLDSLNFDPFERGYSRDEVLENNEMYFLPIGWIGCVGHLITKGTHKIISFGSYIGTYDHIWAYHKGISLENLGKDRKNNLIIKSVSDIEKLRSYLGRFVNDKYINDNIIDNLDNLPWIIQEVDLYFGIRELIEARVSAWFDFDIK